MSRPVGLLDWTVYITGALVCVALFVWGFR